MLLHKCKGVLHTKTMKKVQIKFCLEKPPFSATTVFFPFQNFQCGIVYVLLPLGAKQDIGDEGEGQCFYLPFQEFIMLLTGLSCSFLLHM
jgi:hypothetical protein